LVGGQQRKIDRPMPIVAEIEQIPIPRIFPLNSRAKISDGSARRFSIERWKDLPCQISALQSLRTIEWE
jgi:hypothetical protein